MFQCFNCGREMIWQSDFDFEDYGMDGAGIVSVYHCPHCGTDIECFVPCGNEEDPAHEDLPIDLDDKCDSCLKPDKWSCRDRSDCKEGYPFGECCADNLEDNIGKLCFDNNLPSKLAKDIIDIIKKERERNECLYVHLEYREN